MSENVCLKNIQELNLEKLAREDERYNVENKLIFITI